MPPLPAEFYLPVLAVLTGVIALLWREWKAKRKNVETLTERMIDLDSAHAADPRRAHARLPASPNV